MTTSPRQHSTWVVADTSGYYAGASADEQRHTEARAILARLARERVRFFTTLYVLAELHALAITVAAIPALPSISSTASKPARRRLSP